MGSLISSIVDKSGNLEGFSTEITSSFFNKSSYTTVGAVVISSISYSRSNLS